MLTKRLFKFYINTFLNKLKKNILYYKNEKKGNILAVSEGIYKFVQRIPN